MDDVRNPDAHAVAAGALRAAGPPPSLGEHAAQRWQDENRSAIEAWNAWTDEHGLLLADLDLR